MKILHEKLRNPFVTDTRPGRIIFLEVWEIVIYLELGRHESNLFVFCNSITSMKLLRQVCGYMKRKQLCEHLGEDQRANIKKQEVYCRSCTIICLTDSRHWSFRLGRHTIKCKITSTTSYCLAGNTISWVDAFIQSKRVSVTMT
mmetsp:Transcript_30958/g.64352  ORF Transcript_30958/g.64352 Transcript_30958/m.64352 type:complete len:144 (-) Transcript_30958:1137-1568(-)